MLTWIRVLLTVPIVILTLAQTSFASRAAFVTFAVAALTDTLDGLAARRMGMVSSAGMLWDPIADKVLVLVSMAALVTVGRFPLWAAIILVIRELAITWLRIAMERRGKGFPASKLGKAKTGLELLAVALFILPAGTVAPSIELGVLWAAVVFAIASGADYLARAYRSG
ncbi:MAG: CDP-diacylglycerol--glycerol-3-phosphate 3-phosphatidyltransferase [Actinomycetota bacterium]